MRVAVCGVIAEYDPFHRGHARHLAEAKKRTGAEFAAVVMSGSFTQRGMPALLPAHTRAEMALRCGADIVLQLPYAFSVREAEYFALGGVRVLSALGCVTHLSFGCETEDLDLLLRAAEALESGEMEEAIRADLSRGLPYAAAEGKALEKRLGLRPGLLNAPNAALALSYVRAIRRLRSPLVPVPVLRAQDYHARELQAWPSASAFRGAILRGDWAGIEQASPPDALPVLSRALLSGLVCPPGGMDQLVLQRVLLSSAGEIAAWPGVKEGLEMRILKAAQGARSREELIRAVKTRRYTYGRISRALCHGALNVRRDDLPALPEYARVLGFRQSARGLLRAMQKSGFPLITRLARAENAPLDARADEMWRVLAGLPRGDTFRRPPVIVP
ncbi:MAG: nucleotidyltransferase family protein [Clostridia bacterium]|nr:nucleotidyltransferase family protein [Clostridia bacterium]